MSVFFQMGSVATFIQGVYDSQFSMADLSKKGDIGLGTFNGVDGEMVAVDGVFYCMDQFGKAKVAAPSSCTPFSAVAFSNPMLTVEVQSIQSLQNLNHFLDKNLPTTHIFYLMRLDGVFTKLQLRSESCQPKPYRPLSETLPKLQNEFELINSKGTLVATRCPEYSGGCTIPGYHYHYIDEKRTTGGHVFDLQVRKATVSITMLRIFEMKLQDDKAFDECQLNDDLMAAMKKIE